MPKPPAKAALDENLVVKSNELIQASYAMTVNEQRLLLACISQIDSRKKLDNLAPFTLTVERARDLFYTKGDQRNAYRDLQDASERLFERKVRISLPNDKELLTRFVQSVLFDPEDGAVTIRFAHDIIPYLSQLERNFTQYRLNNVVQLTSSYAVRIYELIVSWTGQGQLYKEMEISEFRELLALDRKYKQFGQLKQFVIEPAVEQINESTDFELDVSFRKSRRAFKWIQLRYNRKAEAAADDAKRKAERKIKSDRNNAAKALRLQAEAAAASEAAKDKSNTLKTIMDSIPEGAVYVDSEGVKFTKFGNAFECSEGGVITAKTAIGRMKNGKLTPLFPESGNLDSWE